MAIEGFLIGPALLMGAIIGLIELIFVHSDEAHMGWLMHGLHALPATMLFVFISMNISFVFGLLNLSITVNPFVNFGVRLVIAVIAMLKICVAAAIAGRVGEKFPHTIAIGALVFAAPYVWEFALASVLGPMLPF
ncbi:hypothetical protein COY95_02970 [Candidatus Woesearchaeota archaeon CG_4_10_14_0_8_um_filter_47_5]|nr:MAG: hypothetical protein COY95_02970 [Candidatus Woesearchaeota archaeon CG_4_10_14_0_8_um_filter_47_5]